MYLYFVVAVVNEYAMKGLDKVEEKLPILQQPADKVMYSACSLLYVKAFELAML